MNPSEGTTQKTYVSKNAIENWRNLDAGKNLDSAHRDVINCRWNISLV